MYRNKIISVVIPSYKVKNQIKEVILEIPEFVDYIIVVDDKCPQKTGEFVKKLNFPRVIVIFNEENLGVGGAFLNGCKEALKLNSDIVVKIDGDGQMEPKYLTKFLNPIIDGKADYVKGNRFIEYKSLKNMPKLRLFGNSVLGFLVKGASGYWNISDPTNGYIAMNRNVLETIDLSKIDRGYFFEIDMLINMKIKKIVVLDIPIPAKYGDEESSLSVLNVLKEFPLKILNGFLRRIFFEYFIFNFNMGSVYIIFGTMFLLIGVIFGAYKWYEAIITNKLTPSGTVMLATLLIILGVEFLLQAINIDIHNIPKKEQ